MTDAGGGSPSDRFEVKATASDHFSWLRTRLSVERTMMSWVRTATALIGFGFTIVQFFARIQETPGVAPAVFSPRAALPRPFPDLLRRHGAGDLDLGIPLGASLSLERKLCGDRGSDDRRESKRRCSRWRSLLALIGTFAFFAVLLRLV